MSLKNYNIYSAFSEYRIALTLLYFFGILLYKITNNKNYSLIYFVSVLFVFILLLFLRDFKKFQIVRQYIVQNEHSLNDKYQFEKGFGYNSYYRNLNTIEIDKLLDSKVALEFKDCYKFPVKIQMIFILTIISFIVIALI